MGTSGKKAWRAVRKAEHGLRLRIAGQCFWNRCPNCDRPFFESGEGSIETVTYIHENGGGSSREEFFCLECLESGHLDRALVRSRLLRRGYGEEYVETVLAAVDRFNARKIGYTVWKNHEDFRPG